jgi:hypothetical protein
MQRSPSKREPFTICPYNVATFGLDEEIPRPEVNTRRSRVRTRRTALIATLAVSAAVIAGSVLAPAGAGPRASVTEHGVTGGTFTSATGNPAAVSSTGSPSPSKGDLFGVAITLPSVKGGLPESNMGVLGGENEKAECDGTFKNPTAPPGFLCVYLDLDHSVNVFEGRDANGVVVTGEGNALAQTVAVGSGRFGVQLTWYAAQPGPSTLYATWAYTAA